MTFEFDHIPIEALGFRAFRIETDVAPANVYEEIVVPGRYGTLLMDARRAANVPYTVTCLVVGEIERKLNALKALLGSRRGYCRLEDSDHPDEYYLAVYKHVTEPTLDKNREAAKVQLEFERKPQRYLKSGEVTSVFTESGILYNPAYGTAQPLIRAYGEGTFYVNGTAITINEADEYTDFDCEMMDAYKGTENRNKHVTVGISYPVLAPAQNNTITLGEGISRLEITPRWWRY